MGINLPADLTAQQQRPGIDADALLSSIRAAAERFEPLKQVQAGATYAGSVTLESKPMLGVIVKIRRGSGLGEALKIATGESQLHRQWRGADRLADAGIPTATGLALWRGRAGSERFVVAAFERLAGPDLIHLLARGEVDGRLAREAGRLAGQVLRAGLFNRDQKPSNIIALPDGRLAIVDTVAVRKLRPGEKRALRAHPQRGPAVDMLASLLLEAMGVRIAPRRTHCMRALLGCVAALGLDDGQKRKALWRAVEGHIADHGDPTPRDNPLARDAAQETKHSM
jgi:hypothetical protein